MHNSVLKLITLLLAAEIEKLPEMKDVNPKLIFARANDEIRKRYEKESSFEMDVLASLDAALNTASFPLVRRLARTVATDILARS